MFIRSLRNRRLISVFDLQKIVVLKLSQINQEFSLVIYIY